MIKLYLDWNVITTLREIESLPNDERRTIFEKLNYIINARREELIIPFSNAHLNDILKNYKKGERERVIESLKFLSALTKDVCLTQYWREDFAKWHIRNPEEFFESLLEDDDTERTSGLTGLLEPFKELGLEKIFDLYKEIPHNIDFGELDKNNSQFSFMFKRSKLDNNMYALIEDVIDLFYEIRNNPVVYNQLSSAFKSTVPLDANIHNAGNVIESLDKYLSKTMLNKSFTELYTTNHKTETSKNKEYSKIISTFMQLDFVGYGSEKLTEKNQYSNLFNDALHCFYGAHCDIFITEDKKAYKKAKAVYQNENFITQVMKAEEFIDLFEQKNK